MIGKLWQQKKKKEGSAVYPLIHSARFLEQCYSRLSEEEVQVSKEIADIRGSFNQVLREVDGLGISIKKFHDSFSDIKDKAQDINTVKEHISGSVDAAREKVFHLKYDSNEMAECFEDMNQVFEGLQNAVKEIKDSVNGITRIANQTNILAINASVEAAHAGEQGKGFMVVASEVNALAEQIKELISVIGQRIENVEEGTRKFSVTLEDSKDALQRTIQNVDETKQYFDNINKTADEVNDVQSGIQNTILTTESELLEVEEYVVVSKKHYDEVLRNIKMVQNSDNRKTTIYEDIQNVLVQVEPLAKTLE